MGLSKDYFWEFAEFHIAIPGEHMVTIRCRPKAQKFLNSSVSNKINLNYGSLFEWYINRKFELNS